MPGILKTNVVISMNDFTEKENVVQYIQTSTTSIRRRAS